MSQLQSARLVSHNVADPHASSVFVVDCHVFKKLPPRVIQDIFRYRHILVQGVETKEMAFDLEGLATLGSISLPRYVQGKSQRHSMNPYILTLKQVGHLQTTEAPNDGLKLGSLADMYSLSQRPDNTLIVNVIDIAMRETSVQVPPQYQ